MPGVLVIEAMAQAAAILSFQTMQQKPNDKSMYYFVGIDGARFKRPVLPGDQLVLEVSIARTARQLWKYSGKALGRRPAGGTGRTDVYLQDDCRGRR